jgi:predicted ABC-type ATPase
MPPPAKAPVCLIIAGPNGAGKTTFAREFLPREGGMVHFVNADLIAAGLSPLKPTMANLQAGRVFLSELDRLAGTGADFAFESTLSGLTYVERIQKWKARGYRIEIVYLKLKSPGIALKRIASRVKEGGHDVPAADVRRRFIRSWRNFEAVYRPLCDAWWLYDATSYPPSFLERHP